MVFSIPMDLDRFEEAVYHARGLICRNALFAEVANVDSDMAVRVRTVPALSGAVRFLVSLTGRLCL